ncbi:ATP-binding protein [Streptomyces sp. NPDC005151]
MHDVQVLPGPSDPPPPFPPELAECGFYLAIRSDGFVLHMSASAEHLREMRAQVFKEVCGAGMDEEVADAARLVASELVGNAVRLCGPFTPVVVQVAAQPDQVLVQVHDPEPAAMPDRRDLPPGNDQSESGRGLWILDVLAPGWSVEPTPLGKQIRCRLPHPRRNCA